MGPNITNDVYSRFKYLVTNLLIEATNNEKSNILGITVPHAGLEYSGVFALFAINELLKIYGDKNELTILWFQHNPSSNREHSLENVKILVKKMYPKIKINSILITNNTKSIELQPPFIVSTDFSHHNYGNIANNINTVWENDSNIFKLSTKGVRVMPCGKEPLRIMKSWVMKNNLQLRLLGYSNSKNTDEWWKYHPYRFDGVTYGALAVFDIKNSSWFSDLKSKMIAYPHLFWCNDFLLNNLTLDSFNCVPTDCGLFYSLLKNKKGSCFVSIEENNGNTYSCFGSWETSNNNLLESMISAVKTVKSASWNGNKSVTREVLEQVLRGNYTLSIYLIPPILQWKNVSSIPIKLRELNKGYVQYNSKTNNIGMTYLPSVWKKFKSRKEFFQGLDRKNMRIADKSSDWELYMYECLIWNFNFKK